MQLSAPCAFSAQEAILAAAKGEIEEAAGITPADAAEKKRKKKAKRQAAEAEVAAGELSKEQLFARGGQGPLACGSGSGHVWPHLPGLVSAGQKKVRAAAVLGLVKVSSMCASGLYGGKDVWQLFLPCMSCTELHTVHKSMHGSLTVNAVCQMAQMAWPRRRSRPGKRRRRCPRWTWERRRRRRPRLAQRRLL